MPKSYHRRCFGHDYRGRCFYMITYMKAPGLPPFSRITPRQGMAKVTPVFELLPLGKIIYGCLDQLHLDYPQIQIRCCIAMPDHLHFLIFVSERQEKPLGSILASFSSNCTKSMRGLLSDPRLAEEISAPALSYWRPAFYLFRKNPSLSVFTPGFNDRIVFSRDSENAFYQYILDNPRRYLVKKLYSGYFRNKVNLELDGRRLALYGNFLLLDNPAKSAVKISRRKETMPDFPQKIREWKQTIFNRGVLVSPFINPEEKIYRDQAIEEGGNIILIVNYTFTGRAKPHKALFELCEEGRLLFVSTGRHDCEQQAITRAEALEMNAIAASIASLSPGDYRLSAVQEG